MPSLSGINQPLRDEYFRLFNLVKNVNGWKQPINRCLPLTKEEIPRMVVAIQLITGSRDVDITEKENGEYRVTAEGYYNAMRPRFVT